MHLNVLWNTSIMQFENFKTVINFWLWYTFINIDITHHLIEYILLPCTYTRTELLITLCLPGQLKISCPFCFSSVSLGDLGYSLLKCGFILQKMHILLHMYLVLSPFLVLSLRAEFPNIHRALCMKKTFTCICFSLQLTLFESVLLYKNSSLFIALQRECVFLFYN